MGGVQIREPYGDKDSLTIDEDSRYRGWSFRCGMRIFEDHGIFIKAITHSKVIRIKSPEQNATQTPIYVSLIFQGIPNAGRITKIMRRLYRNSSYCGHCRIIWDFGTGRIHETARLAAMEITPMIQRDRL